MRGMYGYVYGVHNQPKLYKLSSLRTFNTLIQFGVQEFRLVGDLRHHSSQMWAFLKMSPT